MNRRTFILLILVFFVLAVVVVLFVALQTGGGLLSSFVGNDTPTTIVVEGESNDNDVSGMPREPLPEATPAVTLMPVVVTITDLPPGTRLTPDLLRIENRPSTNIALVGGVTFSEIEDLTGRLIKVHIPRGEAVLDPMLALNISDLANLGSDLALYIDQGNVTIAFPIDRFTGTSFAMRPGDLVDIMMTARMVRTDSEFGSQLPNTTRRVIQSLLLEGQQFLFPEIPQGRLEFIDIIGQTAEIIPSSVAVGPQDFAPGDPIPKRVTQLTIQQAKVMWVGSWRDPEPAIDVGPDSTPTPIPVRLIELPDVVLLSMPLQDALVLKWAMERGVFINLALRGPNDRDIYNTVSISLPDIINQGALVEPRPSEFDFHPRADQVPVPTLPAVEGDTFVP
ncbi:MAG: SAF domain-containing protein [Chloroflexota bacterium]|jgi:Flp pilus assembly protein CpaB